MTTKKEWDKLRREVLCKCGQRMTWNPHWKLCTCIVCGRCSSQRVAEKEETEKELESLPGPYPLVIWSGDTSKPVGIP